MEEFHFYLSYNNPALAEKDPDKESLLDAVKAAVCQNINLFMEMNEEEFAKYLATFAQDVWTQLTRMTLNPGQVLVSFCYVIHVISELPSKGKSLPQCRGSV